MKIFSLAMIKISKIVFKNIDSYFWGLYSFLIKKTEDQEIKHRRQLLESWSRWKPTVRHYANGPERAG